MNRDPRIAELESDLVVATHLLHEIVICAFRRKHARDPVAKAGYRAYCRKLRNEAVAAMATRTDTPEWLT